MRKLCFISEKAQCTFRGERVILHKYTKGINTVEKRRKVEGARGRPLFQVKDSSATRTTCVYSAYQ